MSPTEFNIADDRLDSAEAIANFLGQPPHRTRYLIARGLIPHARYGQRIVGSKKALTEHYLKATSGQATGFTTSDDAKIVQDMTGGHPDLVAAANGQRITYVPPAHVPKRRRQRAAR